MGRTQPAGVGMVPCRTALGKFIRERRLALNLRQVYVSKQAGMTASACSHIENGYRKSLTTSKARAFAKVLLCDPEQLFALIPAKRQSVPKTKLGLFIEHRMNVLGLDSQELARRLGIQTKSLQQRIFKGSGRVTASHLSALAQTLEVDRRLLVGFVYSRTKPCTNNLGRRVRERRAELGMSGQQLADRVGVTRQTISYVELGQLKLTSSDVTLHKFAEALGLPVGELLAVRSRRAIKQVQTDMSTLGGYFAARRLELGLTQREVAERAGHTPSYVSIIEKGYRVPLSTAVKIAEVLECQIPMELEPAPGFAASLTRPMIRSHKVRSTAFGRFITERRLAQGLSQAELAEKAGLSQGGINGIETGRNTGKNSAEAIVLALGCTIPPGILNE